MTYSSQCSEPRWKLTQDSKNKLHTKIVLTKGTKTKPTSGSSRPSDNTLKGNGGHRPAKSSLSKAEAATVFLLSGTTKRKEHAVTLKNMAAAPEAINAHFLTTRAVVQREKERAKAPRNHRFARNPQRATKGAVEHHRRRRKRIAVST